MPIPQSPADKLKATNFAQWCRLAACSLNYCSLCHWPLDLPTPLFAGHKPSELEDPRCTVCNEMETILYKRAYWTNLAAIEGKRRKNMGLEN